MNIVRISQTALICASLLGATGYCLSSEIPQPFGHQQVVREAEAVILRIERNNVTLQDLGDRSNRITAPFSNAAQFKAGDKVFLVGDTMVKVSANTATDRQSESL